MYHCYIDESGDLKPLSGASDRTIPVCVIAGAVVHHDNIRTLTNDFLMLKGDFYPGLMPPDHFLDRVLPEIKGADLRRALREGGSRNKRRHAIGVLDAVVDLLEAHDIKIIGRIFVKPVPGPCNARSLYTLSVQRIAEAFDRLLEAEDDHGLMVADSRTPALNAQVAHSIFTQKFKSRDAYGRVLEMPTFGHSQNHVGIQIADLIASALLLPMATFRYCTGHVDNVHVDDGFAQLVWRYGDRLRDRVYVHRRPVTGRIASRGRGLTVADQIAQRGVNHLFTG